MSALTRRDWLKAAAVSPVALSALSNRASAAPSADDLKAVVDKGVTFLKSAQKDDGQFFPKAGEPGLTALVIAALVRNGIPADNPIITKGMGFLQKNVHKDGGVYEKFQANYMTSLAVMTFKELNAGGKYDKVIADAVKFLRGLQNDSDPKELSSGGVGYDGKTRPDLSNTNFMVEALLAGGVSKDDPAIKKALVYIGRCQNLPGEFNDQPFAWKAADDDKGGFVYNPADQSNEKSPRRTAAGGLRSEGGMTYGGLKSFLYAGVGKDDKRVQAAVKWVRSHYTVTENPGAKQAGVFYYYHTLAKAMDALGEDMFADAKGVKHDWRQELFDELKRRQKADGSWTNPGDRFLEDVPELATAFALLAISYCKKK